MWDVIVIGGGAAGLMTAIEAGKRGRRVLLLEHQEKVGKKILISGGGRCNFTNLYAGPENYLSSNRHFCKSALARYRPADFIALVKRHQISFHEKKLGQLFCDQSAQQIVDLLVKEAQQAGVRIETGRGVTQIEHTDGGFSLSTPQGPLRCTSLVLASGGLSIPKIGATDFGFRVAKQWGHRIQETYPALVPLSYNPTDLARLGDLSGIALDTLVQVGKTQFRENSLFAHFGLSGPAILQISSYWRPGQTVRINLLPDLDALTQLQRERDAGSKQPLGIWLNQVLPKRLAARWSELYGSAKPLGQYGDKELRRVAENLNNWQFQPGGTEGYRKAEVTAGGLDTKDFSSQTFASRKVPGLYCVGELLDVTGWLGGYNFQWAWASGFSAGQSA
jgi:predicted Rossmann fold flavoprotein